MPLAAVALFSLVAGCGHQDDSATKAPAHVPATDPNAPPSICVERGKNASRIAGQRIRGTPLASVLQDLDKEPLSSDEKTMLHGIAQQLYEDSFASKLSPESAATNYEGGCITEFKARRAHIRVYSDPNSIARELALFRTYTGQPLVELLANMGITVNGLQISPGSSTKNSNYKAEDTVYTLTLTGTPNEDSPCHLHRWLTGDIIPSPEVVQRGPAFPLIRPTEDDPLIYWASTGKCSAIINNAP